MNNMNAFLNTSALSRSSKLVLILIAITGAAIWLSACKGDPVAEGKAFFTEKGCVECHSVSAFGLKSQQNSGPDLTLAVEDAPKRFGKSLDDFWDKPTGTMEMVLSQKIKLNTDDRAKALQLIKAAYELRAEKAQK